MLWRRKKKKGGIWLAADERPDAFSTAPQPQREGGAAVPCATQNTYADAPQGFTAPASPYTPENGGINAPDGCAPDPCAPQSAYGDVPQGWTSPVLPYPQENGAAYAPFAPEAGAGEAPAAPLPMQVEELFAEEDGGAPGAQDAAAQEAAAGAQAHAEAADNVIELFPQEEADRPERRGFNRRLARAVWAVFLFLLVAATFLYCLFSFRVEFIEAVGNEDIPAELIIETSAVEKGTHMFMLATTTGEERLLANPYIKSASIRRDYPSTVYIEIEERQEAAAIIGIGAAAIVDADGYVLSIGERPSYANLLKIYGAGSSGYQVNGRIADQSDYASRVLSMLIDAVRESGLQEQIESADIANPLSLSMLTRSGITVNMGQAEDLDIKLQKLAVVLPEVEAMGYTDGTISLYRDSDPVYSPYVPPVLEPEEDGENESTHIPSENDGAEEDDETGPETEDTAAEAEEEGGTEGA